MCFDIFWSLYKSVVKIKLRFLMLFLFKLIFFEHATLHIVLPRWRTVTVSKRWENNKYHLEKTDWDSKNWCNLVFLIVKWIKSSFHAHKTYYITHKIISFDKIIIFKIPVITCCCECQFQQKCLYPSFVTAISYKTEMY